MRDQEFWVPFLVSLCSGMMFGAWIGYGLSNGTAHKAAIALDCAYYDGKTGEFKWRTP